MEQLQELHLEAFIPLLAREVFGAPKSGHFKEILLGDGGWTKRFWDCLRSEAETVDVDTKTFQGVGGHWLYLEPTCETCELGQFLHSFWKKHSEINDGLPFGSIIGIGPHLMSVHAGEKCHIARASHRLSAKESPKPTTGTAEVPNIGSVMHAAGSPFFQFICVASHDGVYEIMLEAIGKVKKDFQSFRHLLWSSLILLQVFGDSIRPHPKSFGLGMKIIRGSTFSTPTCCIGECKPGALDPTRRHDWRRKELPKRTSRYKLDGHGWQERCWISP